VKLLDIRVGDFVQTDDGFTCMTAGRHRVEKEHYLKGQEDEPGTDLVGIHPIT
jgi:hypothetical protein